MTTTAVENFSASWDDARDIPFWRIAARIFTPAFCVGATALLASYDDEQTVCGVQRTPAVLQPAADAPTAVDTRIQPDRDLIPVRVRWTR